MSAAEGFVVGELPEVIDLRCVRSADRAVGILSNPQLCEPGRKGFIKEQSTYQGFADSEDQLDHLIRLQQAHHSGHHSEDAIG